MRLWKPREIRIAVNAGSSGRWVDVAQLYYPGWIAKAPGLGRLALGPSVPEGFMRVWVPGEVELRLAFPWGRDEQAGLLLTGLSAVILSAIACSRLLHARSHVERRLAAVSCPVA